MKQTLTSIKIATLLSIAVFLFAGSLQAQVTADFDKKRLQDSFKSEFAARGLTYDANGGDMAVSLCIFAQTKTDVTVYTNYSGGHGYRRAGWGVGYGGMGSSTTSVSTNDYNVGTLVLDCYDVNENKLLFQGV